MSYAATANFIRDDMPGFVEPYGPDAMSRPAIIAGTLNRSAITARVIQMLCEIRQDRARFLPRKLLGEPGWDILLQLYAAHLDGQRMTITELTRSSGIAATTVLRWLKILGDEGLLWRTEDPFDMRRVFVSLSPPGEQALGAYFADTGTRALLF